MTEIVKVRIGKQIQEWEADTRVSSCSSCGESIRWATTPAGKKNPLDAQPEYVEGVGPAFTSHFATCQNAERHRTRS